jgi:hypothetical protein
MPTSLLASGFETAWLRYEEARRTPDTQAALESIFEAVAWAGALRDRFGKKQTDAYPELGGFWFVRNLVLHRGADALDWAVEIPGAELDTFVLDVSRLDTQTIWRARWRSASTLPKGRDRRNQEAEYEEHLAGRDIAETLGALTEKLRQDAIIHRDHLQHRGLDERPWRLQKRETP